MTAAAFVIGLFIGSTLGALVMAFIVGTARLNEADNV